MTWRVLREWRFVNEERQVVSQYIPPLMESTQAILLLLNISDPISFRMARTVTRHDFEVR